MGLLMDVVAADHRGGMLLHHLDVGGVDQLGLAAQHLDVVAPQVILDTAFGGQRWLDELEDDPLPRIC